MILAMNLVIIGLIMMLVVPNLMLAVECLAGLPSFRPQKVRDNDTAVGVEAKAIVLVPAHNEAAGLEQAMLQLHSELGDRHEVLVVADNCSDRTAEIARRAGATVIERTCPELRGKGYALRYGVEAIAARSSPPDVVVVLDADCSINGLNGLVSLCNHRKSPIQCAYLMDPPAGCGIGQKLSAFAFRVKNLVRLRGLRRLGGPSLLTGSGMAFPWDVMRRIDWGGNEIVEDYRAGLRLIEEGCSPAFSEIACVRSLLPTKRLDSIKQSRRWEHGQLNQMFQVAPRLIFGGILHGQWRAFLAGLDVLVPPISLLAVMTIAGLVLALLNLFFADGLVPLILLSISSGILAAALALTWTVEGRDSLPARYLFAIPVYILQKLSIYAAFFIKRESAWVRTTRS
ncbi:glycosyltransferase family 2 protein [Blastopirellula marina]|uniref:Glycosyl transferase n=1 Tax=Blastopirellula marina TaxID=124 RepID=A0A2S8GNI1_9BACT|nr:glycosyltransferase family 2 protein [Blastopirellula marina]PQO45980.1 glycosyl transferase [Blastopirellula marina]